jgi:hypothetical protein
MDVVPKYDFGKLNRRSFLVIANVISSLFVGGFGSRSSLSAQELKTDQSESGDDGDVKVLSGTETDIAFPLTLQTGKRYLQDADGKPFLMCGDSAWSLIVQPTRENVDLYLDDRRSRGFNAILVELIEHRFADNAPANVYGDRPFLTDGDYGTPNERYFAHADWVLRRAAQRGFLVLLAPSWIGAGGGNEGWYQEMSANGVDKLRRYGQYLGERYREMKNILWVHGGDYNPPNKDLVRAIAMGIRDYDTSSLNTAHCAPETAAADYWQGEPWLQVNTVYTYGSVFAHAVKQYSRTDRLPFFLIESAYENEHAATEQRLRAQAYQALLTGAAGQCFGNNPIWHFDFDGPGLNPAPMDWKRAMKSRGAQSITHLRNLFVRFPWWLLEPDFRESFVINYGGFGFDRVVAARSADRSYMIAYLPISRQITVDFKQLAGPNISGSWYDPTSGDYLDVSPGPLSVSTLQKFDPPRRNKAGSSDWILVLKSQP